MVAGHDSVPSVIVRMRRRAPDEKIEAFRRRLHLPQGEALRNRLAAWAEAVLHEATDARPRMPAGVEDRNADVWEALLGVADLAGGDWPNLSRRAATELVKAAREIEPSLNIRLLEDLRTIFEGEDSLSTKDVLARLCLLEDAPWNDLKGKPITDRQLSQRLGAYGVKSKTVRIGAATPRGYARGDLHDLWRRYLPPLTDEGATSATPATTQLFQLNDAAASEIGSATSRFRPQQDSGPNVAVVADDLAPVRGSSRARTPDGTSNVVPVADVAPSTGNGGGPSLSRPLPEAGRVEGDGALQPLDPPRRRTRI